MANVYRASWRDTSPFQLKLPTRAVRELAEGDTNRPHSAHPNGNRIVRHRPNAAESLAGGILRGSPKPPSPTNGVWGLRPQRVQGRALAFPLTGEIGGGCVRAADGVAGGMDDAAGERAGEAVGGRRKERGSFRLPRCVTPEPVRSPG